MRTLLVRGYVEQERRGAGYELGPMAYGLAMMARRHGLLARVSDPIVHEAAETTGETTLVAVLSGTRRMIVAQAEGKQTIRVSLDEVLRDDLHGTATGLVLTAYAPRRYRRWILHGMASYLPDGNVEQVVSSLESVRSDGHVVRRPGEIVQIAVPVRHEGRMVAAIGSFIPGYRNNEEHEANVLGVLKEGASSIEADLADPLAWGREERDG
jgi:DNA-binding IclR family transcriptional regulator